MKQYLKPGGILLVTEGPDDAQLAMHDPDYELIGAVKEDRGSIGISPGVAPQEFIAIPQSEGEDSVCCPIDRVFCFRKKDDRRKRVLRMVYCCDNCHFLFSRATQPEQCPDCGKYRVRPATEEEQAEFARRLEDTTDT